MKRRIPNRTKFLGDAKNPNRATFLGETTSPNLIPQNSETFTNNTYSKVQFSELQKRVASRC